MLPASTASPVHGHVLARHILLRNGHLLSAHLSRSGHSCWLAAIGGSSLPTFVKLWAPCLLPARRLEGVTSEAQAQLDAARKEIDSRKS